MATEGMLVILVFIAIGIAVYRANKQNKKIEPWMSTMASSISHSTHR